MKRNPGVWGMNDREFNKSTYVGDIQNHMAAQEHGLELKSINKSFSGLKALNNVSFKLQQGTVLGLIGPNGAGKTTLLNTVSGLSKADSGEVWLDGKNITSWPSYQIAAVGGISRTFQNIRMFQGMTVLENVLTGLHAKLDSGIFSTVFRLGKERAEERNAKNLAMETLASLGLEQYCDRRADQLSYGIQRRVEIARALVSSPRLLLLDEPTAGMTPRETNEVMELVQSFRDSDLTIVVIEHKAGFIMNISDQVIVLNFGTVIANGQPEDVRSHPSVIEAYLGVDDAHA
jgi:branched-chain amino acid transport system ATP-binding protein